MISLLLRVFAAIAIAYSVFSFHYLSISPNEWGYDGRFVFIMSAFVASAVVIGLNFESKK